MLVQGTTTIAIAGSEPSLPRLMFSSYAERYVLKSCKAGRFLGVNALTNAIEPSDSTDKAWVFHTHDGAVTHALWIGEVHGETPDVVRLS